MTTPINTDSISIVVQGRLDPNIAALCIRKLRQCFPGAEIIISTWEGSDTSGLDVDVVLFSPDPGAVLADEKEKTMNNVNRQLISTWAGLNVATRPYLLKTRTDILFENADFLSFFGKYDGIPSSFLEHRLLICNYYTRNPRAMPLCFHPSDWIVFGTAADVRKYYEAIPLMGEDEGAWFRTHKKDAVVFTNYVCRYTPEQHIFLHFLQSLQSVCCDCYYHRTPDLVSQTERAFAECFVVLDFQKELAISFPKYNPNRYFEKHTLLSHRDWKVLYIHYCENGISPQWTLYRIRGWICGIAAKVRRQCVLILNRLGWKARLKTILTRGYIRFLP